MRSFLGLRQKSAARGIAWLACTATIMVLSRAVLAAWPAPRPAVVAGCAAPIEMVAGAATPRLACADADTDLPPACQAHAGDKVVLHPAAPCRVIPDGMRASWMVAWGLPLDINHRSASDLTQVPGISTTLAQRIVQHREAHGAFTDVAALRAVQGIGAKTLPKLAPYLAASASPGDRAAFAL